MIEYGVRCEGRPDGYTALRPDGITAHATAADLSDLLDAHLAVLRMLGWDVQGHDRSTKSRSPQKNRSTKSRSTQKNRSTRDEQTYWLHATNIQITLCRLTGERPRLPRHWFNPLYFTGRNRLKAFVLDLLGVEGVARMFGRER